MRHRRLARVASATAAGLVAVDAARRAAGGRRAPKVASRTWRARISSHDSFTHDSIDSLGYDWERIADPGMKPRYPFKVYIPQTTEDVVRAVREAKALGERLRVRSKGHSSNDLVLSDGASVLLTEKLNGILSINEETMTATVQAGAVSALVDDELAGRGLGLPVIGDHAHITVGGFASVGGISPASHRFGMFVDNVVELEYVDWDGELHRCSPTVQPERFRRVLAGLGTAGVMVTLTLRLIRIDKYGTVWRNDLRKYMGMENFIEGSVKYILDPGDAMMERGVFVDFGRVGGRDLAFGQFSAYHETGQSSYRRLRQQISYGYLHGIGYMAGRLPKGIDKVVKYVGMTGVLFSPRYASIKNVEFFTDKLLDSSVGDPTRMLIVLGPLDAYGALFRELMELCREARARHECFTFISVYVKSITSPYLGGDGDQRFCELMFYNGIDPEHMTPEVLDEVVSRFDDICIAHGAFRYMHSKTVKDEERRRLIDPNARYWAANVSGNGALPGDKAARELVEEPKGEAVRGEKR